MSKKKIKKKKAAPKKAAPKKAVTKKTKVKKTAPKKVVTKKTKSKLGFDPLALDVNEPIHEIDGVEVGIDALIRDTTSEDIIAMAAAEGSVDEPEDEEVHGDADTASESEAGIDLDMAMDMPIDEQPTPEPETEPIVEPVAPEPVAPEQAVSGETDSYRDAGEAAEGDTETFFSFKVDGESYAIQIGLVKEVLEYVEPTKVPQTLEHMKGVINLRGGVIPVVCLRGLFGLPEVNRTVNTAIVIVEVNLEDELITIGVLIDAVREVMKIKLADIEPPAEIGNMVKSGYIMGMGKVDDDFVMILDVDTMLSMQSLTGQD